MKRECIICGKASVNVSYREHFLCENCLDYIRGLPPEAPEIRSCKSIRY